MNDEAKLAFWLAQSSELEGRARAAGHLVQNAATLGVTAVASGLLAAGVEALNAPVLAVIVSLIVWLLALIASLNWAEMKVLARRRDLADNEIADLLTGPDRQTFDRLRETGTRKDVFTITAIAAVIALCVIAFGAAFVAGIVLGTGLGPLADILRFAVPAVAVVTVAVALISARIRIRSLS